MENLRGIFTFDAFTLVPISQTFLLQILPYYQVVLEFILVEFTFKRWAAAFQCLPIKNKPVCFLFVQKLNTTFTLTFSPMLRLNVSWNFVIRCVSWSRSYKKFHHKLLHFPHNPRINQLQKQKMVPW